MTGTQSEGLPKEKTIIVDDGTEYIIGRPLMKHKRQIAKIIRGLQGVYGGMAADGTSGAVVEVAEKMGLSVEALAQKITDDGIEAIPEEYRSLIIKSDEEDAALLESLADFQTEMIQVCLKKAPFEWDPKIGTLEQIENNMEYGHGMQLMEECIPYILDAMPKKKQKKQSSKQSSVVSPIPQ